VSHWGWRVIGTAQGLDRAGTGGRAVTVGGGTLERRWLPCCAVTLTASIRPEGG
jgi:hypothetical protein